MRMRSIDFEDSPVAVMAAKIGENVGLTDSGGKAILSSLGQGQYRQKWRSKLRGRRINSEGRSKTNQNISMIIVNDWLFRQPKRT
jgi:hypothetical protein